MTFANSSNTVRLHAAGDISWADWERFLVQVGHTSVFHTPGWLKALARNQGYRLRRIGIFDQHELIGIVPFFEWRIGPLRIAASPFVATDTPYLGVLLRGNCAEAALAALASYQDQSRIHFMRLLQREGWQHAATDYSGFDLIQKHTHLLDLSQREEEIWKGMEGRCRTAIRKAEKSGVRVHKADGPDSVEVYYDMFGALYRRQRMSLPNTLGFFHDVWNTFHEQGLALFLATLGDEVIAGAIIVHDGDRFYYLDGVSKPEHNAACPNNLVQWNAIRYAKACGGSVYDLVGSDIPRLAKFKKSFGGELVTYTCFERASSRWVTLARKYFPVYKQVVGRVTTAFRSMWKVRR